MTHLGGVPLVYDIPAKISHFEDRDPELARAFKAFDEWRNPFRPVWVSLSGIPGIGTTELAYEVARGRELCFPDGVLYIDLNEFRPNGRFDAVRAVEFLLHRLGGARTWPGGDASADCYHRWRTRTKGAQLVIVVDNAQRASEVTPLLPTSGSSMVIVTSSGPLDGLEGGDAVSIAVGPLWQDHAERLLVHAVGERLNAGSEAAQALARLCAGLPAAIHVAACFIRGRSYQPLPVLLDMFRQEVHEVGLPRTEVPWDAVYESLNPDAAGLYRLLADVPGTTVTEYSAAAILGCGPRRTAAVLGELAAAGLTVKAGGGFGGQRIRLLAPLYPHASRCARRDGDEVERAAADRRAVLWHLRQAQRADELAAGIRLTLALRLAKLPEIEDAPINEDNAYQWLEAERNALYECVARAYANGMDTETWSLCEPLFTHYHDHPHHECIADAFRMGLEAAQRAGDARAMVRMRSQLAFVYRDRKRFDDAERELVESLAVLRALGSLDKDRKLKASVIEFRGRLREDEGRLTEAEVDYEYSLNEHMAIYNGYGVMLLSYRLGRTKAKLGDFGRAVELLEEAHSMARQDRRQRMAARTGYALADVVRGQGQAARARELCLESLDSARKRHSDFDEARILDALASLAEEAGNTAEAQDFCMAADEIRERNGIRL